MTQICTKCGTAHSGAQALPGSGWIELVLWLCYLVPGVIYSIWRRGRRQAVCGSCGSKDLVAADSPVGRRLAREHYPDGLPAVQAPPAPAQTRPAFKLAGWGILALFAVVLIFPLLIL